MIAVSIDGVLVAPEQASVSVFDRGFLYGDGVFEVLRTHGGVATDLAAHLARLFASAAALRMTTPSQPQLARAVEATVSAAGPGEHRIRVVLTRGPGSLLAPLGSLGPGRTIVIVEPLPALPTELWLAVVDWPLPRRVGPAHKTLAYLDHVLARELAAAAGADEAVRLGPDGDVVECATSNVFAVMRGTIVTPPTNFGILPGVTRARVLAACDVLGLRVEERRLSLDELYAADEIFVTSALRGVVPVTKLDGVVRTAGPVTSRVIAQYLQGLRQQTVAGSEDPI